MTQQYIESFQVASDFLNKNRQSPEDTNSQRILLGLYRFLAEGNPLSLDMIADRLAEPRERVVEALGKIPKSSVELDEDNRIVGFGGLTLNSTRHQIRTNDRTLHTWCAFDTLFAPGLLGKTVEISSSCPITEASIYLTVGVEGVLRIAPETALLSFVTPQTSDYEIDIRSAFCCHVNFLESEAAAMRWTAANDGALILSIEEGFELGRIRNGTRFSEMLFS